LKDTALAFLLIGLGLLQMAFGVFYLIVSQSAVHEAVAAMLFGLGTLALGLGAILQRMETKPAAATPTSTTGELITIYRMCDIRRSPSGGVTAAGNSFANVDAAKAFIDKRDKGEL
jgi:tellurite resistance protein TehA-like permease